MKTIAELRDSRAKLWSAMESFLDTHANDNGVLSAEDDATYNKMEKDLEDLTTGSNRGGTQQTRCSTFDGQAFDGNRRGRREEGQSIQGL